MSYDNRAFRYGYGLFETLLVTEGSIELSALHWQRLLGGMRRLGLAGQAAWTPEWLEEEVLRTVRRNGLERLCRVRLQVFTAGNGLVAEAAERPQYLIECFPVADAIVRFNRAGLVAGIAPGLRKSPDSLAGLKSCNALIYVLAARHAREQGWDDALVLNTAGRLIESSIANLFWVADDTIYTPPLSEGCVAGVFRLHLMNVLRENDFTIREQILTLEECSAAREIWLTNSIRKLQWVKRIGPQEYSSPLAEIVAPLLKVY